MNAAADTPAADRPPVYDAADLARRLGDRDAVRDLTFRIRAGDSVAVIGPSGAGKTTLLRLLAGLLWPTGGTLRAFGDDTARRSGRRLRAYHRRVGFLQQSDNLIPGLRVAHNVLMGNLGRWSLPRAALALVWPRELRAARQALAAVELEDRLWSLPTTLSGGEQQRVAIARLLVQRPDVFLADEPVTGLDNRLALEVVELLARLARERNATLVVSLHDLHLLGRRFDRVLALRAGRLYWQGRPDQLTRGLLEDLYGSEHAALAPDRGSR